MLALRIESVIGACGAVTAAALCNGALAASSVSQLADLSLEQLANIEVTSVAKRSQRLADAAGSVFVISSEDIRRSAATSLPEVLRLAPNLQVARMDANQYAITARGFNSTTANKLLVLIDGRTVYSPLYSGVFWDVQDVVLEDVERIEVLSGSGGTLFGSNAVNGVINIITRPAKDTQGAMASLGYGDRDRVGAVRYGGMDSRGGAYRVYGKYSERSDPITAGGAAQRSASKLSQVGFRSDRDDGPRSFTLQGDAYEGDIDQPFPNGAKHVAGANLLARWVRDHGDGASSRFQAYYDRTERNQPGTFMETLDTYDVDFQWASQPRPGHQLLLGGGYRFMADHVTNISPALSFLPPDRNLRLGNVFVQDEIALATDVTLTGGLKLEHNDYTGLEYLPNVRLAWKPRAEHLIWGGVARTVRTPSRIDREAFLPGTPPFSVLAGGANFESEVSNVFEVGYRAQPVTAVSYSFTLFHHDLQRQRSVDPGVAGSTFGNGIEGTADGLEAWATYRITPSWKINAGLLKQNQDLRVRPGSIATPNTAQLGNDPNHQWSLGSSFDIARNLELDVLVRNVGPMPNPAVPGYTALDARVAWRVRPDVEVSLSAQNLTDRAHPEWGSLPGRAEIERSVFLKIVWRL